MATNPTVRDICSWVSPTTGNSYPFSVYGAWETLYSGACVYIYAVNEMGMWKALYVGQTNDLKRRMREHEYEPLFAGASATHIHVHWQSDPLVRVSIEGELGGR